MSNLAILFAVFITVKQISSTPQSLDLESILELANGKTKDSDSDVTLEEKSSRFGSLKSQEVVGLLKEAISKNSFNVREDDKRDYRDAHEVLNELLSQKQSKNKKQRKVTFGYSDQFDDRSKELEKNELEPIESFEKKLDKKGYQHHLFNKEALEQLLSENVYEKSNKRLKANPLVGSYDFNNNDDDKDSYGYSKIYVILNPQAIEKSNNKEKLNSLLRNVLSLTSSQNKRQVKKSRQVRYKGFPIKADIFSRRARYDSRESYGGKDSNDDDYKHKRIRNDRASGGAGGRTAIPYIRNRGDIYERDH